MTGACLNAPKSPAVPVPNPARARPLCSLSGRQHHLNDKRCDMQRSIHRLLETIAATAMVVLLLYVLLGPPT
jgi:hypothetical protein